MQNKREKRWNSVSFPNSDGSMLRFQDHSGFILIFMYECIIINFKLS